MQVGYHISVALKDQLILKLVYDKNLSLSYFSAVLLKNFLASLLYKGLATSRNTAIEIWQPACLPVFGSN
jgi:hypothetical protein